MPLPEGPGVAVSVNYIGPLRVTPQGNNYILLITDRFSRRADLFPVTGDEFTGKGAANILVNKYIPPMGVSARHILGQPPPMFLQAYTQAVYQLLGVRELATSSYNSSGNGGVERVIHTLA